MREFLQRATLCSAILLLTACGPDSAKNESSAQQPVEVTTISVSPKPLQLQTVLPGRSKAFYEAEVRPQVSGIITKQSFTEGTYVEEGQSLYQIDPDMYEADQISAKAALAKAEATLSSAKAKAVRYSSLVKTNAISKQDYDEANAAYHEAVAQINVAKAALNTANINLKYTKVKAPISGQIGKSSVTAGALVTANQANSVALIQQLDPIKIDITRSSAEVLRLRKQLEAGKLKLGDSAKVSLQLEDGSLYPEKGILKFTEVTVNPTTGSVILRAEFPNPNKNLLPGMYVRAILNIGEDPNAILVPQKAVMRDNRGKARVMLVKDGKAISQPVETAEAIDNQWRIVEGLKAGDQVIVHGLQKAQPNAPVKVVSEDEAKSESQGKDKA